MQESIDSLQEQIDNPVADDDDDDDFDGQEEKANETNVVTPLLSPLNSPNSHGVGPKPRPMSARPQSARRRCVPFPRDPSEQAPFFCVGGEPVGAS